MIRCLLFAVDENKKCKIVCGKEESHKTFIIAFLTVEQNWL